MPYAMTLSGSDRGPSCTLARRSGRNGVRPCVCTDSRGRRKFAKQEECGGTRKARRRRR